MKSSEFYKLTKYTPPAWASKLAFKPEHRVRLAMLPTPISKWNVPTKPPKLNLYIKRDDLTGCATSGNKIRKLEFLLAEAVANDCRNVITCGGIQSNHCRATAAASRELGLNSYLFLRADDPTREEVHGNMLVNLMCGSRVFFVPKKMQYKEGIEERMKRLASYLLDKKGEKSYCVPIGGSNLVGSYGYVEAWREMMDDEAFDVITDVVVSCGSGGSAAGLAIANHLTGSKKKIHAVSVSDDRKYFHQHINDTLSGLGLNDVRSEDIVDVIDGYKGYGYGATTPEDLRDIRMVSSSTGVFCDPVYTWKGVKGLLGEFERNRERFKGENVLFVHTGGLLSLYDGKMNELLQESFDEQAFNDLDEFID